MKTKFTVLFLTAFAALCFAQEDTAPTNELAFGLGGVPALSRSDTPSLDAGSGVAFQVNYGRDSSTASTSPSTAKLIFWQVRRATSRARSPRRPGTSPAFISRLEFG